MKPKIFIGSSVEGLGVAYAIQQNLTHDAEPTVWDQGVFELSRTTVESLSEAVDKTDFGIFVFSPDDVTKMRGGEFNSIRDNVIFEFGLFTGRLGRDRVFFIKPDGFDLHIPTDLLGVTPATYNPDREDGRLQAATGPACNQIREIIKKLPIISSSDSEDDSDESSEESSINDIEWLSDIFNGDYSEARRKLKRVMEDKAGEDLFFNEAWMIYIDFKEDEVFGLDSLLEYAHKKIKNKSIVDLISRMLSWEKYYDQSLSIIDSGLKEYEDIDLIVLKSEILEKIGDKDGAVSILSDPVRMEIPRVAIALSERYEKDDLDKAIDVVHSAYRKYPSNKSLVYRYARLLQDKECNKEALYLLNYLCVKDPKNHNYHGYLSNSCIKLDLYDKSMIYLKKAIDLSDGKESWLLNNVGNLLNNKGFYTESEEWLRKGLEVSPSSEYGLDRLSKAVKNRVEEGERFSDLCREGGVLIRGRDRVDEEDKD